MLHVLTFGVHTTKLNKEMHEHWYLISYSDETTAYMKYKLFVITNNSIYRFSYQKLLLRAFPVLSVILYALL